MPLTFWKICLSGRKGEFEVLFWIWLLKAIIIDWYIVCHNMEVQMLRVCWEYICCPMFCFFVLISMIWVSLYYVFVKSCLSLLILSLFSIHFSLFFWFRARLYRFYYWTHKLYRFLIICWRISGGIYFPSIFRCHILKIECRCINDKGPCTKIL